MREIKIRAKYIDRWLYGNLVTRNASNGQGKVYIMMGDTIADDFWVPLRDEQYDTIGQFTGLHDRKGKEIYEGDIIQLNYPQWNYIVFWNDVMLCFDYRRIGQEESHPLAVNRVQLECYYEVIGNIHDNPELLKGGEK